MRAKLTLLAGVCAGAIAFPAFAQQAPATQPPVADSADAPIIVTATLRQANVQDIPIAVTAVAPAQLERQGVQDIKNLAAISSSFSIQSSQTESQGTSIRIRGVGTTGNNIGLESSVGVFIDGVYQSRPGVALGDLVDLERLEILRGPQGTLFGRNTSAGALNITTKRPNLNHAEGFVNASYGNYNFINVQGGFSVPIAPGTAAIRVAGAYRKRDGWMKSILGPESNNRDRYILRGQFYAEPSNDLSIRIIGDYSDAKEKCCDAINVRETEIAALGAYQAYGLANDGIAATGGSALDSLTSNSQGFTNNQRQYGASGEIVWSPGAIKITSITAYRDFSSQSQQDDFTSLLTYSVGPGVTNPTAPYSYDKIKTFTQELRLQGSLLDDKLDFLIGGYYSNEKIEELGVLTLGRDYQASASTLFAPALLGIFRSPYLPGTGTLNPLFATTLFGNGGVPVNAAGSFAQNLYKQDSTSYSIFTHNVFNLTDRLSVTAGARYVKETKDGSFSQLSASSPACQAISNGILTGAFTNAGLGGFAPNLLGATCFPFATSVGITAPANVGGGLASRFLPLPRAFSSRFSDDELTYTGQIGYKFADHVLFYASYSHGFKSGGFNLDSTAAVLTNSSAVLTTGAAPIFGDPRFKSEKVNALEAGLKTTFGRFNANFAVFDQKLTDFQVLEFTGIQFVTFNVDKARSTGAEAELFGRIAGGLSANLGVTYTNARYPKDCMSAAFLAAQPTATPSLLCGSTLTNAPRWAGVVGLTYDGPLNDAGWTLLVNGNVQYSSDRRTSTTAIEADRSLVPFDIQRNSAKINLRAGFGLPGGRFSIEAWGTNLTNSRIRTITFNTPLRGGSGARDRSAFVEEPRMYGVTARAKF